jgi:hypothetical protein
MVLGTVRKLACGSVASKSGDRVGNLLPLEWRVATPPFPGTIDTVVLQHTAAPAALENLPRIAVMKIPAKIGVLTSH